MFVAHKSLDHAGVDSLVSKLSEELAATTVCACPLDARKCVEAREQVDDCMLGDMVELAG